MRLSDWQHHPIFGGHHPEDPEELLFHYTSLASAAGVALTKRLLLSPLSALNDPQESSTRSVVTITSSGREESPRRVPTEERESFERELGALRDRIRVACLTRDIRQGGDGTAMRADGRGFARARTWTQYGDQHAGVCLVFNRERLEAAAADAFGPAFISSPVSYVDGFDDLLNYAETVNFDTPDAGAHFEQKVVRSLLNKNADWSREREHRIVTWDRDDAESSIALEGVVAGLVLGVRFPIHRLGLAEAVAVAFGVENSTGVLTLNNTVLDACPVIGPDGAWHRWTDADLRQRGTVFDG